jgi:predicted metal-binding membrane protein
VIERVLRHERALVVSGVVAVAGLAWLDLWRRAHGVMDMAMPEMEPWSLAELGAILAMWLVMMVAMMLPSAVPMLLLFAATQRGRATSGEPRPVLAFATGYLLVWGGFSVAAAALQALLFVGGVMNLAWVAVLGLFVLGEKMLPRGAWLSRIGGVALIAWAVWLAAMS